jgi:hypothetical protein
MKINKDEEENNDKMKRCTSLLNRDLNIRENSDKHDSQNVKNGSDKSVSYYQIIQSYRRASSSDSKKIL